MEKLKLKELRYNAKTIEDDFHRMILFDKNHRLIAYFAIKDYAEDYVIGEKEVNVYDKNNSLIDKVLHVVIDKVCNNASDLDTQCPIKYGEDEYFPNAIKEPPLEPENIKHDESKIHKVTIDEFIPKQTEPTIHFDKKVFESGLSFREAYMRMVEGKKISRPCFIGWWFMNHESKVIIHDRYGNELKEGDITNTVTNTLANDWEVIE